MFRTLPAAVALIAAAPALAQDGAAPSEAVIARFAAVAGAPTATGPDGAALPVGRMPLAGATIATGAEDRVAVLIARHINLPAASADWMVLGPDTEVRFDPAPVGEGEPVLRAALTRGTVHLVTGDVAAAHICAVVVDGAVCAAYDDADLVLAHSSDGSAWIGSHTGRVGIQSGDRKITLRSGMYREVQDGKVRAARSMSVDAWSAAIAPTAIAGFELPKVAAAPPAKPVVVATPVTSKPPARTLAHDHDGDGVDDHAPAGHDEPAVPESSDPVFIRMETSKGPIVLELDRARAPISVANFVAYANDGFYDGTIFHRVIPGFMIQGGGFTPDMERKQTKDPIQNEWRNGLKNLRGTIAMARTNVPDSATSQFFINVVDNPNLDVARGGAAYAVFGRVLSGMEVVDAIRFEPTTAANGMRDVPVETVMIDSVRVVDRDKATN